MFDKCNKLPWANITCAALVLLMLVLSGYDLCSAKFTAPTVLRQSQTAMLTENFASAGFSLDGLYLDIFGNDKRLLVLEFPIYNFFAGLLGLAFGHGIFWGKLVSLVCSVIALLLMCRLLRELYGEATAWLGGLFFVLSPIGVMMRTAYQPDAMAMMFAIAALLALRRWHESHSRPDLAWFCFLLLLSGLTKFPLMIPFLPLIALGLLTHQGRFRRPGLDEMAVGTLVFLIPFVSWYLYRGAITAAEFDVVTDRSMFLVGDLTRFLAPGYYVIPAYTVAVLGCSLAGLIYLGFVLKRMSPVETALLAGVPLYYVLIPTVKDQHYYIFACVPALALLMARGHAIFSAYCRERRLLAARNLSMLVFLAVFVFVSVYAVVLRKDETIYRAAREARGIVAEDDLVVTVMLHNRTVVYGGHDPTFFYYAGRRGWNAHVTADEVKNGQVVATVKDQVVLRKGEGARWLVVSWYSAVAESPVEQLLPKSAKTSKDPGIDGLLVCNELAKTYQLVSRRDDYAIFRL